jgi:SH3 domain-containing YSC84-like protein 1
MILSCLMLLGMSGLLLIAQPKYEKRLNASAEVFGEIMDTPDQSIPQDLLNKAECIVVVPGAKKGAFIFGGKYGRGYLSCRRADGIGWSSPGAVRIEGFNFGLQIGGSETDIVMLVMNEKGARRLMKSKFTLGGDASGAAGPVGRTVTANTDILLTAEILSWSRARGVFAGISLDGSTLRHDLAVNNHLYGQRYSNRDIVTSGLEVPEAGKNFISLLNKYSGRKGREAAVQTAQTAQR